MLSTSHVASGRVLVADASSLYGVVAVALAEDMQATLMTSDLPLPRALEPRCTIEVV